MSFLLILVLGAAAGFIATKYLDMDVKLPIAIGVGILGAFIGVIVLYILIFVLGALYVLIGAALGGLGAVWAYQRYVEDK